MTQGHQDRRMGMVSYHERRTVHYTVPYSEWAFMYKVNAIAMNDHDWKIPAGWTCKHEANEKGGTLTFYLAQDISGMRHWLGQLRHHVITELRDRLGVEPDMEVFLDEDGELLEMERIQECIDAG